MQGVESNPGPATNKDTDQTPNLMIRTYNCNGLGKVDKLGV